MEGLSDERRDFQKTTRKRATEENGGREGWYEVVN